MTDNELALSILKYLEYRLTCSLSEYESREINSLIKQIKQNFQITTYEYELISAEIDKCPVWRACPVCRSPIIEKWSGIKCSKCDWWSCS